MTKVNFKMRNAAIVFACLAVVMMTACGGGNSNNSGNSNSAPPASNNSGGNEKISIVSSSVSAFLSSIGLTETDVKPANAGEGTVTAVTNGATVSYTVSDLTVEQKKEWLTNLYNAIKNTAKDKEVYGNTVTKQKVKLEDALYTTSDYYSIAKVWEIFYKDGALKIEIGMQGGRYALEVRVKQ